MAMENRGSGRPAKERIEVDEAAVQEVRQMVKEYKDAKLRIVYFENVKLSLISRAELNLDDYEKRGMVDYNAENLARFPERDRKTVNQYLKDKRTVFCLERGIEAIKDPRTKAIAIQTLLEGRRCEELIGAWGIRRRMLFMEKRKAITLIAAFIENNLRLRS